MARLQLTLPLSVCEERVGKAIPRDSAWKIAISFSAYRIFMSTDHFGRIRTSFAPILPYVLTDDSGITTVCIKSCTHTIATRLTIQRLSQPKSQKAAVTNRVMRLQ